MPRLLSQSQFARKKKLHRSTISKWVRDGKITINVDGRIDPLQAEKDLMANNPVPNRIDSTKPKRRSRKRRSSSKATTETPLLNEEPTLTEARRQNELLKGELLTLKLKVERGELISKEEPDRWLATHVMVMKDALWTLPRRLGEELATEMDHRVVESILQKEVRRILTDLSSQCADSRWSAAFQRSLEILDHDGDPLSISH